ncbi:probable 39S ribosomal protein L45, mitochondrial isoform X3 [Schistocerca gregaria]|uniref:probable 39S ribosomal protein L45, mitochondrial isoform X3 n=1 Tax=Schistocerca gregaria TaxID=7010 RepID=UPI00211DA68C|nr:probable 39S ribosomal protein L45, mitochondrial isoform X3 [Schistocerca gregaria]
MAVTSGLSSGISRLRFLQKCIIPGTYSCGIKCTLLNSQHVRCYKHWNPKFKRLRGLKVQKIELPNFEEDTDELSEEEVRSRLKERGLLPPRPWVERPFFISCTGGAFEPYVPPEGDGKMSIISVPGAKQKFEMVEKKSKSMMAIRKIRSFEEEFNTQVFTDAAQEIYINAHNCMASKDFEKLQQFVTERAYPILAVYDRFGRLMHGSEILAKDVLEYVVFEKHMANQYGIWRIHDKIIPDWMPPREPMEKTYVKTEEPPVETQVQTVPENKAQETVSNV